jgi:Cu(I)/Ag(I) efflux system membrane fusion protein
MIRHSMFIQSIVCAVVLAGGMSIFFACSKNADTPGQQTHETIYHCPMHPNYLSHEPGNCPICGMKLVKVNSNDPQPAGGTKKILYYRDAMNPSHTSDKPGKAPDGMDLVPVYADDNAGTGVKIDPAMIQSTGVQTEKAAVRSLTREIRTSATIMPDERRIATITTKVMGYIEKLHVDYTGQRVTKGQPLYDLYSPDLVSAQAEYVQTFNNLVPGDSGQLLRSARRRLLNWDVTEGQIAELEQRGAPEKNITVVSPVAGIVTEKMVASGQAIEPGMQLYKIVDYARVWIEAAVYQQDIPLVKIGQRGVVELDYYPGEQFVATVTYIAPELNMESRTLMVRLEIANTADLKIKPGMSATVTLQAAAAKSQVTVPEQAVIHSGVRTLVVVAKGGGYFESRDVKTGQTAGGFTELLDGVREGEDIVVSSQFLIDSESNLKVAVMKMAGGTAPMKNVIPSDTSMDQMTGMNHAKSVVPPDTTKQLYTCPMHPEIIRDKPGSCPICELVPKKRGT